MSINRTVLQQEADRLDRDLHRVMNQIEQLGDRMPIAGPKLRGVARKLSHARSDLRDFMHSADREVTQ